MHLKYLYFFIYILFVSPLFASQEIVVGDWEEEFTLTNNIVVKHTRNYVQFDQERATEQICIPKRSKDNDFIYPESLILLQKVSRADFIQNLINSKLYKSFPEDMN